jgi:hypothetical protein
VSLFSTHGLLLLGATQNVTRPDKFFLQKAKFSCLLTPRLNRRKREKRRKRGGRKKGEKRGKEYVLYVIYCFHDDDDDGTDVLRSPLCHPLFHLLTYSLQSIPIYPLDAGVTRNIWKKERKSPICAGNRSPIRVDRLSGRSKQIPVSFILSEGNRLAMSMARRPFP